MSDGFYSNNCQHGVLVHDCYYCSGGQTVAPLIITATSSGAVGKTLTKPLGFLVLLEETVGEPSPDWDGKLHKERADAESEVAEAISQGFKDVRLGVVFDSASVSPTPCPTKHTYKYWEGGENYSTRSYSAKYKFCPDCGAEL